MFTQERSLRSYPFEPHPDQTHLRKFNGTAIGGTAENRPIRKVTYHSDGRVEDGLLNAPPPAVGRQVPRSDSATPPRSAPLSASAVELIQVLVDAPDTLPGIVFELACAQVQENAGQLVLGLAPQGGQLHFDAAKLVGQRQLLRVRLPGRGQEYRVYPLTTFSLGDSAVCLFQVESGRAGSPPGLEDALDRVR